MAPFDSYKDLLIYICTLYEPKNVLEYGPGGSTSVILKYSDAHIHSIEHEHRWYQKAKENFGNNERVDLHYIPDHDDYITSDFGLKYDFIFVDGLCAWRVDCLKNALNKLEPEGVVALHDSERTIYDEGVNLYEKKLELGGTVLLIPK